MKKEGDDSIRAIWHMFVNLCVLLSLALGAMFCVPKLAGLQVYAVMSGSMEPELPVGSLIYVQSVEPQEIQPGDSISFWLSDRNIVATHQVYAVDLDNQQFYTQGINNKDSEGNIIQDGLPFRQRKGRTLWTFLLKPEINIQ